jgi:hypothetical protein
MGNKGEKYGVSKSTKRLPVILLFLSFVILCLIALKGPYETFHSERFLIFAGIFHVVCGLCFYFSLKMEQIIIYEDRLIYKKIFKKEVVMWKDINKVLLFDTWTALPYTILKGDGINIKIDTHSFSDSEDLVEDLKSHLGQIPMKKSYEFTEV